MLIPKSDRAKTGILDQDALARYALEHLISQSSDLQLVVQWKGIPATCELMSVEMDVLTVSIETVEASGVALGPSLALLSAHVPVLATSACMEPALVVDCLQAGAKGFVWKGVDTQGLMQAVRAVLAGDRPIMPSMADRLVSYVLSHDIRQMDRCSELTGRENEVLGLIANGLSNKEIAATLSLSVRTVKAHVSNVLRKLDVADRTQAALVAVSMDPESRPLQRYYRRGTKVR
ncbi:MAG: LuxR C-terminal-related transcriptional regulator [Limnochordia bacterium]|jgi:DNA-binding NarL/FixJ family response regulator